MNVEIEGLEIARAMDGRSGDQVAAALVGCKFYTPRMADDYDCIIESADPATGLITITSSTGKPVAVPVASGSVVPSELLNAHIYAERSLLDVPYPDDAKTLADAGVTTVLDRAEAAMLAAALRHPTVPDDKDRFSAFELMNRRGLEWLVAQTAERWIERSGARLPADLVIRLAPHKRRAGQAGVALALIQQAFDGTTLSQGAEEVLLTERTAAFLDLHEIGGGADFLGQARKSYETAMAIRGGSGHLALAGSRLERSEILAARASRHSG